jgi:enamine deaminase RidA (YjgF/YER057c/UK114 family)
VTVAQGPRVASRLATLGLTLPSVPAPAGMYVPAVLDGRYLWTAGQLPLVDGALPVTGAVGTREGDVDPQTAASWARVAALNTLAAAASVVDLDRIERVVKVVGFVASAPDFTGHPLVINGASALYGEVFGESGHHARSAVGVAALPLGSPVEVEAVFAIR